MGEMIGTSKQSKKRLLRCVGGEKKRKMSLIFVLTYLCGLWLNWDSAGL